MWFRNHPDKIAFRTIRGVLLSSGETLGPNSACIIQKGSEGFFLGHPWARFRATTAAAALMLFTHRHLHSIGSFQQSSLNTSLWQTPFRGPACARIQYKSFKFTAWYKGVVVTSRTRRREWQTRNAFIRTFGRATGGREFYLRHNQAAQPFFGVFCFVWKALRLVLSRHQTMATCARGTCD